jgi:hypothetical protein
MDSVQQKAMAFVSRLLQNPSMEGLLPLQKEEQIAYFLQVNQQQLHPTLSSAAFFPGNSWEQIFAHLWNALQQLLQTEQSRTINSILHEKINFNVISSVTNQNVQTAAIIEKVEEYLAHLLARSDARRDLSAYFSCIYFAVIDNYVHEIFERKEYLHFELTKVQRLKMNEAEISQLLKIELLLKPGFHLLGTQGQEHASTLIQPNYAAKSVGHLKDFFQLIPAEIIESSIFSNTNFEDYPNMDATSRIISILGPMCKSYRPNMTIDKGADSHDKSWLGVGRRNFRYYGWDIKAIDELYKIAAENSW